jgi:hypothetical protein
VAEHQITSGYDLSRDAWTYELTGPSYAMSVVIPDVTPDDGPFTPADAANVRVHAADGAVPWLDFVQFLQEVEFSGDITPGTVTVIGDLTLSLNSWHFGGRIIQVASYHDGENDGWCYELYEDDPGATAYIDVRIPDLNPTGGPFAPATVHDVVVVAHGSPTIPWPVLQHFLNAISATGDIVGHTAV